MRARTVALIVVLLFLVGAAGFIGWQIYTSSQAPDDSGAQTASDGCDCSLTGCNDASGNPINGCWQWNCNANCTDSAFKVYLWHCPNTAGSNAACNFCGPSNGGVLIKESTDRSGQLTVDTCGLSQLDIGYNPDKVSQGIITGSCFGFTNTCGGTNPPPPTGDTCPFVTTKARVHFDNSSPWTEEITLDLADRNSFQGVAFQCRSEDGAACDSPSDIENVVLTVNGGEFSNRQFTLNGPDDIPTINVTEASVGQTITVTATHPNFSDGNCRGTARVRVVNSEDEGECGDGQIDAGEQCDPPGSTVGGQTCNDQCQLEGGSEFCGDGSIDDGEQCGEPGLTCSTGSTCNVNTCLCEDGLNCGDSCSVDTDCPTDHVCQGGTCVLTTCANNPGACEADRCTLRELPRTDITGRELQGILIGALLVVLGVIVYRSNIWEQWFKNYLGEIADDNFFKVLAPTKVQKREDHQEGVLAAYEQKKDSSES